MGLEFGEGYPARFPKASHVSCECGKENPFESCCGRFLDGSAVPTTAEELMRSRFVAFGFGNFDYIEQTQLDSLPDEVRKREAPEWESLEILECSQGGPDDDCGTVEFRARYRLGESRIHHELSRFVKVDNIWRYQDGDVNDTPVTEEDDSESQPRGMWWQSSEV